jgi:hypothetical protein
MTCAELNTILEEFSDRFQPREEVSLYWSGEKVRWLVRISSLGHPTAAGDTYTEASTIAANYVGNRKTELERQLLKIKTELESL